MDLGALGGGDQRVRHVSHDPGSEVQALPRTGVGPFQESIGDEDVQVAALGVRLILIGGVRVRVRVGVVRVAVGVAVRVRVRQGKHTMKA